MTEARTKLLTVIDEFESLLVPEHNDTRHTYTEDKTLSNTCSICGWYKPQTEEHTIAEIVLRKLEEMLVVLDSGTDEEIEQVMISINNIFDNLQPSIKESLATFLSEDPN